MEANSGVLHSIRILASIVSVLKYNAKKVRHIVGTLTYSVLIGATILPHRDNI